MGATQQLFIISDSRDHPGRVEHEPSEMAGFKSIQMSSSAISGQDL